MRPPSWNTMHNKRHKTVYILLHYIQYKILWIYTFHLIVTCHRPKISVIISSVLEHSITSDYTCWQLCAVNTFPISLHEGDCHLMLSDLEVSHASYCVIDRTGVELPGLRNTVLVSGVRIADHPTPTDYIWAPIILSDELLKIQRQTALKASMLCSIRPRYSDKIH